MIESKHWCVGSRSHAKGPVGLTKNMSFSKRKYYLVYFFAFPRTRIRNLCDIWVIFTKDQDKVRIWELHGIEVLEQMYTHIYTLFMTKQLV